MQFAILLVISRDSFATWRGSSGRFMTVNASINYCPIIFFSRRQSGTTVVVKRFDKLFNVPSYGFFEVRFVVYNLFF